MLKDKTIDPKFAISVAFRRGLANFDGDADLAQWFADWYKTNVVDTPYKMTHKTDVAWDAFREALRDAWNFVNPDDQL